MGGFYKRCPPGFQDTEYFLQKVFGIVQMFNDMFREHLVDAVSLDRIRVSVQVMDDIGIAALVDIHPDRAGDFIAPATDIEYFF